MASPSFTLDRGKQNQFGYVGAEKQEDIALPFAVLRPWHPRGPGTGDLLSMRLRNLLSIGGAEPVLLHINLVP